ncbi:MAG: hypothetical protein JWR36_470 [Glaciihabitans sp.]|jgi:hypothetical protein|nr:hypothetical protein [Glaciihabitans sp.]
MSIVHDQGGWMLGGLLLGERPLRDRPGTELTLQCGSDLGV